MEETMRQQAIRLKCSGASYGQIARELKISPQRAQQLVKPQPLIYGAVVRRADGMCQSCFRLIDGPGDVHHRRLDVDDFNGLDNLLLVCNVCHPLLDKELHSPTVLSIHYKVENKGKIVLDNRKQLL